MPRGVYARNDNVKKVIPAQELKVKTVKIWLQLSSEPIVHEDCVNSYTKGDLFCVYTKNERVYKYPIANIFSILEDYGTHMRE